MFVPVYDSVAGGALLLASLACCVLAARRRHRHDKQPVQAGGKTSQHGATGLLEVLFGTATPGSTGSAPCT